MAGLLMGGRSASRLLLGPSPPKGRVVPVKDRLPFASLQRGKTNIAVLVDAEFVSPQSFERCLESLNKWWTQPPPSNREGLLPTRPSQLNVCLNRIFAVEESPEWLAFRNVRTFERFLVDSFIPSHIQILADLSHIMDHRRGNGADGVCLAVSADHHTAYTNAFSPSSTEGGWFWVVCSNDGRLTAGEVALDPTPPSPLPPAPLPAAPV